MSTDTREELPPLPKKRRAMFCTKCGFSGPTEAEASPRGAPCQKCNYIAFVEEVDYSDDEMQAYARAALAPQPAQPSAQGETGWISPATVLPDGSAFAVASFPLPKDHWLYAPRGEWDNERDDYAETPRPILTNAQRDAVIAAARYAIRGATMCGQDPDFDPDAMALNFAYAMCGPARGKVLPADASAPAAPAQAVPLTDEQIDSLRGLDTASRVRFYEHDYYVLSNFSAFTLVWKGIRFDTSEAAYHFEKFSDCDGAMADVRSIQWDIRTAPSAHEAFKIAERNRAHRRPDWDDVKVGIMLDILRAKAEQHEYVRRKLLTTGDRELVEDSWRDDFWGWGPNRDGKNMLGRLWMQVRSELHGIAPKAAQPQEKT